MDSRDNPGARRENAMVPLESLSLARIGEVVEHLEAILLKADPLVAAFGAWLGIVVPAAAANDEEAKLWTPRDVALAGLQEVSGKKPIRPFNYGLSRLRGREFFRPHSPGTFEADPLAILSVAIGIRSLNDRQATNWIYEIAKRAADAEIDPWRMGLLAAARTIAIPSELHQQLPPELAFCLNVKGIQGFGESIPNGLVLDACLTLDDVSPEQAAVKLAALTTISREMPVPRKTASPSNSSTSKVHVGIITIKEEEFLEVVRQFKPTEHFRGRKRDYERTTVTTSKGACQVAITRCVQQGTAHAQMVASEFFEDLAPGFLLVVGIGGGIPTKDFTLGDVIVSSFVYDLTLEDTGTKRGRTRFSAQGGPLDREADRIVSRMPAIVDSLSGWPDSAKQFKRPSYEGLYTTKNREWNLALDAAFGYHRAQEREHPIVRVEPVVSSDRLVKDPELVGGWRKTMKHIACVEMESAGVYTSCRSRDVPFLAIRGISDIVGWTRDEEWTLYACQTAAIFARRLVGTGIFLRS
jgi:nucleoside phosphorylase